MQKLEPQAETSLENHPENPNEKTVQMSEAQT